MMRQPDLVDVLIFLLGVALLLGTALFAGLVMGFGYGKAIGHQSGVKDEQQRQRDITNRVNAKVAALICDDDGPSEDETEPGADDQGRYIWPNGLPGDLKTQ